MTQNAKSQILASALELSPGDRLSVANELLDSVEGAEDEEWSAAWLPELDRRAAQAERGEVELEDWGAVKAQIRHELRSR